MNQCNVFWLQIFMILRILEFESLRANFLNIDGNLHTKNL